MLMAYFKTGDRKFLDPLFAAVDTFNDVDGVVEMISWIFVTNIKSFQLAKVWT